jgi:glycosyltransferase involved in cell wall biosynthesis
MTDRPLKIVHVITRFIRGGADENTLLSCNSFAERGHAVTLIYGDEFSQEMVDAIDPRVDAIQVPALRRAINPVADLRAALALWRIFRRVQPDVIHTHTSKAGVIGRIAARAAPSAAVVHGIHILPFVNVGAAEKLVYLSIERMLARMTHRFVSVSPAMRDLAIANGVGHADRHDVVFSGMNLSRYLAESRDEGVAPGGDAGRRFHVVYAANYEPRKQHLPLLEALARRARDFSDTTFVFAGHGRQQAVIEERVRALGLEGMVSVVGFVEDLGELIRGADLCIYCSSREGLPRVVVQYCAAQRPVVALDLPGLDAVVTHGHNGLILPAGDFDGLTAAVRRLLDAPQERRAMAEAAGAVDLTAWSADTMYVRLNEIYRGALSTSEAA